MLLAAILGIVYASTLLQAHEKMHQQKFLCLSVGHTKSKLCVLLVQLSPWQMLFLELVPSFTALLLLSSSLIGFEISVIQGEFFSQLIDHPHEMS